MKSHSLIRIIYLYTFSAIGLVLMVISGVNFINTGLKAFVFKGAEQDQYLTQPPMLYSLEKIQGLENSSELSEQEREMVKSWLVDYKNWQDNFSKIDYLSAQRQRTISVNLAMLLIGLPLYLYHWFTIKREFKKENQ